MVELKKKRSTHAEVSDLLSASLVFDKGCFFVR